MALEYRALLFYGNHKGLSYRLIISVVWKPTLQLSDCYVYKMFSEFDDNTTMTHYVIFHLNPKFRVRVNERMPDGGASKVYGILWKHE